MSVSTEGGDPDHDSFFPSVSLDGRYVVFESYASNLVAHDTNRASDIFITDLRQPRPKLVSVNSAGHQATSDSLSGAVSAFGRYVAFSAFAPHFDCPNTSGDTFDVFVKDMRKNWIRRVSLNSAGQPGNGASGIEGVAISAHGRRVVFDSLATNLVPGDSNSRRDLFVRDLHTGRTQRVSVDSRGRQANGESRRPSMSADGRFVAFESDASNLVSDDTNEAPDMFVRDLVRGVTRRVSVSTSGAQGNAGINNNNRQLVRISGNGRFVTFASSASNLVPGDTNEVDDVFVRDTRRGVTERVSVGLLGEQADAISFNPVISVTGRFVAFPSVASNLTGDGGNGMAQVYLRDRRNGTTRLVSTGQSGELGDDASGVPAVWPDGTRVAFSSFASNLVPGDKNGQADLFMRREPRWVALGNR